jgi:hypothetical protein
MRTIFAASLFTLLPTTNAFPPTPFADGVLLNLTSGPQSQSCSWTLTSDNLFHNDASHLCVTASNPSSASGVIYLTDCGRANQSWTWVGAEMDGGLMYIGENARGQQCLTGVDPRDDPPSAAVLSTCTFASWQQLTSDNDGNGSLSLNSLPGGHSELFVCSPNVTR